MITVVELEAISRHSPGRTEDNHEKCVRVVDILAEIQTGLLLNTNQKY
jgi:hypothetical protein